MKDLSMHIMDILQNSTRAKANNITLEVLENYDADTLTLIFKDDGCGMNAETVEKVTNPFFTTRTTRKVGLGLPLLKQNTEMTGGSMKIDSEVGVGTTVTAVSTAKGRIMRFAHVPVTPMMKNSATTKPSTECRCKSLK